MAARSVFNLFSKTCASSLNSPCPSRKFSLSNRSRIRRPQLRSYSQPPECLILAAQRKRLNEFRSVSKSLINFTDCRDEDFYRDITESTAEEMFRRNAFPSATDMSVREPAREFRDLTAQEEAGEDGSAIYELTEGAKSEQNLYDVLDFMKKMERAREQHLFMHLQPNTMRPFGSSHTVAHPQTARRTMKIVYPVGDKRRKKIEDFQPEKEFSGFEKTTKGAFCDSEYQSMSKMKFSTAPAKRRSKSLELNKSKLCITDENFARRSSTVLLKTKKQVTKKGVKESVTDKKLSFAIRSKKMKASQKKNVKTKKNEQRNYAKWEICEDPPEPKNSDYVTIKLGDVKDKCKPKKINFGRLPKLIPPDCPCIENIPLKEGKPICRLKKRAVRPADRICLPPQCPPRADANLKVVPKSLPKIKPPEECPCEEREMTDFVIKRLQKRKVSPPKRYCPVEVCLPRADAGLVLKPKSLPKLEPKGCPCIEEIDYKDVRMKRLKAMCVKEPPKVCPPPPCVVEETLRADRNYQVKRKLLRPIKGECECVEPPPLKEGKPFRKLKKRPVEPPPRICPPPTCEVRADEGITVEKKLLPVFVASNCPCKEPEPPSIDVNFKRLKQRSCPKEPPKICIVPTCPPRADDGMKVKQKTLPKLEAKECPCVQVEMFDVPPLKKLVPRPVEPPPPCVLEIPCTMPRADALLKTTPKKLPPVPVGNCPCVEPPIPLDVKPLKKLQKRKVEFKRVCKIEVCPPRADDQLKIKAKRLPKLEPADCPCIEASPPEDVKPLPRLKKKPVCEPPKCKIEEPCLENKRADADDWLYWKRVEVKSVCDQICKTETKECEPAPKRSFSTLARKFSTNSTFEFRSTNRKLKPVDCIAFVIHKNQIKTGKLVKNAVCDIYNFRNRFISTCNALCDYSDRKKGDCNDETCKHPPSCECPPHNEHLQPKKPIIPPREEFVKPWPPDKQIEHMKERGKKFQREDPANKKKKGDACSKAKHGKAGKGDEPIEIICGEGKSLSGSKSTCVSSPSLWQRILDYFKARDCPSPQEFKKIKLKEEAERAASRAGLCLYDPKELLRKDKEAMPKVITADTSKEEICK